MQISGQQCSWRIFVRAKASSFNFTFRFRATSFGSNWTLRRFSLNLNFRKFLVFRLNSHPVAPPSRLGLIRTRTLHVIQKFQSRITAKNPAPPGNGGSIEEQPKDLILAGFWVSLAFLVQLQHIWKKYGKEVFILILPCVGFVGVLLIKRAKPVKVRGLRINCIAIIAACSLLLLFGMLGSYGDGIGMYVAKQVWELIS